MTTERTYRCNLCRDEIRRYAAAPGTKEDGIAGVGVYFTTGSPSGPLKFVHMRDAENHLCMRCLETLQVLYTEMQNA